MNIIADWFKECNKIHRCGEYDFAIVNGFKVTHYLEDDTYTIQDARKNDFYTSVSESDMEILMKYGFVIGTSIIMYHRNVQRVEYYLDKLAEVYAKRERAKKMLKTDRTFYSKQIRNANANILANNDMVHYYKSKVEQFEPKFLKLTKTQENE